MDINQARIALERELQKLTNEPVQPLVERMIDMVKAIRVELRKTDGK
jgi:hypothetical protein|tara:strand:+ start:489 stop:629 length:141 start_codon:yes stop_codon:yes gene_type:complete